MQIVNALEAIGSKEAAKERIQLLSHNNYNIVRSALLSLDSFLLKHPEFLDPAINILIELLQHPNWKLRNDAISNLAQIGDKKALKRLNKLLSGKNKNIRKRAAKAIVKISSQSSITTKPSNLTLLDISIIEVTGDESSVNILIDALKDDNKDIRLEAVLTIGRMSLRNVKIKAAAIKAALDAIYTDNDIRWHAASVLVWIGSESVIEGLVPALRDKDPEIAGCAAYTLAEIGGERTTSILKKTYLRNSKYEITKKFGKWGVAGEAAIAAIAPLLHHNNEKICENAAFALGDIGSISGIKFLYKALQDNSRDVRYVAVEALVKIDSAAYTLGDIGNISRLQLLNTALQNDDSYLVGEYISKILRKKVNNEGIVYLFFKSLKGNNSLTTSDLNLQLVNLADKEILADLTHFLSKVDNDIINKEAADLLVEKFDEIVSNKMLIDSIRNSACTELLFCALKDKDYKIRSATAKILAKVGNSNIEGRLIGELSSDDDNIVDGAAETLGYMGSRKAVDFLVELLRKDSSPNYSIVHALEQIGDPKVLNYLLEIEENEAVLKIQHKCGYYNYSFIE